MSGATTTMTTSEAEAGPSLPFIIVASSCGTLIEWYCLARGASGAVS
jgi:hypothetical protein